MAWWPWNARATPASEGSRQPNDGPPPTEAHGVVEGNHQNRQPALWIPRAVLYIPRLVVRAISMPIRGGAFLYDRFRLPARVVELVSMDDGQAAIVPVAQFESGLGGQYGLRVFHKNLFRKQERASARTAWGPNGQRTFGIKIGSGRRIHSRVVATFEARYANLQNRRFFGIGNGRLRTGGLRRPNQTPIDPLSDQTAIPSRYQVSSSNYRLSLALRLVPSLSVTVSSDIDQRRFTERPRARELVSYAYEPSQLVGYDEGLAASRTKVALTFSNFRRLRPWISQATPSKGWFLHGELEYARGIVGEDPSNYLRHLVDIQRLFDLFRGDRVLLLRAHIEAVSGPLDKVPFERLPALGGPTHLRGFPTNRFRDRVAHFYTVEYRYPIGEIASGFLFFDVGRTFRSYRDIEFRRWQPGGGPGLIIHTRNSYIARIFLAFSSENTLLLRFNLDPLPT